MNKKDISLKEYETHADHFCEKYSASYSCAIEIHSYKKGMNLDEFIQGVTKKQKPGKPDSCILIPASAAVWSLHAGLVQHIDRDVPGAPLARHGRGGHI